MQAETQAKTKRKRGRPSKYTSGLADTICKRLAGGETLKGICRDAGMPRESTVRAWVMRDEQGFYALYTRAREYQMEAWSDEIVSIADEGSPDNDQTARDRLRIDTRKFLMAKIAAKRYGDRVTHEVTQGEPLRIVVQPAPGSVPASRQIVAESAPEALPAPADEVMDAEYEERK